jgi:hypothetical protein
MAYNSIDFTPHRTTRAVAARAVIQTSLLPMEALNKTLSIIAVNFGGVAKPPAVTVGQIWPRA